MNIKVVALIAAGGQGVRIASKTGRRKQFMLLEGKPVVAYTIERFQDTTAVEAIILVVPADAVDYVQEEIVLPYKFDKVVAIIPGGKERQDSVEKGLEEISDETEIVVVHDAVRPFLTCEMIEESVRAARKWGASIVGIKSPDTMKEATEEGMVRRTLDRDSLWCIQTPQAYKVSLLKNAFIEARKSEFYGTDESTLVERLGHPVRIIKGSSLNIKITTPEDLCLARAILNYSLLRNYENKLHPRSSTL